MGCGPDIRHLHTIIKDGSSADRQIGIYKTAKAAGRKRLTAIADVVDWVAAETLAPGRLKASAKATVKA
jgi:carboxylate-amine ligase